LLCPRGSVTATATITTAIHIKPKEEVYKEESHYWHDISTLRRHEYGLETVKTAVDYASLVLIDLINE
jgi:hypothetical protein